MRVLRRLAKRAIPSLAQPLLKIGSVQRNLDRSLAKLAAAANSPDAAKPPNALRRLRRWQRLATLAYPRPTYRLASLANGSRLVVDVSDTLGLNLFNGGPKSDEYELRLIEQLLAPGDTAIDVGANIGLYTVVAARAVGSSGHVYSFEPVPATFDVLQQNVELNSLANVVASKLAMSDVAGTAELAVTSESGLASLGSTNRGTVVERIRTQTSTLDSFVQDHALTGIKLIKVDVEGFEGHVLRGAAATLERERSLALVVELSEENFSSLGFSAAEVISWMGSLGYVAWAIDRAKRSLVPAGAAGGRAVNYLFARRGDPRLPRILTS